MLPNLTIMVAAYIIFRVVEAWLRGYTQPAARVTLYLLGVVVLAVTLVCAHSTYNIAMQMEVNMKSGLPY